jgi:hypothetical protein
MIRDVTTLTDFRNLKEYQPISLVENPVPVFKFFDGNVWHDCRLQHVLYEPMIVQLSFPDAMAYVSFENPKVVVYDFQKPQKKHAVLELKLFQKINLEDKPVVLFEVLKAVLFLSPLKMLYLKRLHYLSLKRDKNFIKDYDFSIYQKLVALFSFPKQVWLVSLFDGEATTNFPVDLCSMNNKHCVIGVRNSNRIMTQLTIGTNFYVSTAAAENYAAIYTLGKFSGSQNTTYSMIKEGDFQIPDIIGSCFKLQLKEKITMAHQTLYIAAVVESKTINPHKKSLYHMHKIWLWQHSKIEVIEK